MVTSPSNDRLVYFSLADAIGLFDEIAALRLGTREIGFTGGEPFMNPDIIAMLDEALGRGFEALVLTNAMQPMQRPRIRTVLLDLKARFGDRLGLRVSIDHYTRELHEAERGPGSWQKTLDGLDWLAENLAKLFEDRGRHLLRDPWAARDAYIDVILDRRDRSLDAFVAAHAIDPSALVGAKRTDNRKRGRCRRSCFAAARSAARTDGDAFAQSSACAQGSAATRRN